MQRNVLALVLVCVPMAIAVATLAPPQSDPQSEQSQAAASSQRSSVSAGGEPAMGTMAQTVLQRDSSGQFHMTLNVNGQDIRFLVDTGADTVALTLSDAERAGVYFDPESFEPITRTASGIGYGTEVMIETLEIGGNEFREIDGVVIRGLSVNLLGQSVLRRLGKVELQGDSMVIHHGG